MVTTRLSLPEPCLALCTNRSLAREGELAESVGQAVDGGVQMVQLREKDLPGGALLKLAHALQSRVARRALFIVNERVDVALAVEADGVHLGESGLPVADARKLTGDGFLIGRSIHSVEAAKQAQAEGADYLICGTIFETKSKPGKRPEGLPLLREVTQAVNIPVLAIGGVNSANVGRVLATGAGGACVISAILASQNPKAAAEGLRAGMAAAAPTPLAS